MAAKLMQAVHYSSFGTGAACLEVLSFFLSFFSFFLSFLFFFFLICGFYFIIYIMDFYVLWRMRKGFEANFIQVTCKRLVLCILSLC